MPLGIRGTAAPKVTLVTGLRMTHGFLINLDIAGANPLVPGAPDIDLHANLRITVHNGLMNVVGSLRGDAFPNAEVFVTDAKGTGRMIMAFATSESADTGPMSKLPGDARRFMNGICHSFGVDSNGLFR